MLQIKMSRRNGLEARSYVILGISPGTLQNLRVTGKIRYKKVMGSYYYNSADLEKLFRDGEG